jgi:hypothetical protein
MVFEKWAGRPPEVGSPMEMIFLAIWKMRQNVKFQETRVLVQAMLSQQGVEGKLIEKAFEDLKQAYFPFEKTRVEEEKDMLKKALQKEVARGGMRVTPMADMTRPMMKQKLNRGTRLLNQKAELLKEGRLKPLDQGTPFTTAKRRPRSAS